MSRETLTMPEHSVQPGVRLSQRAKRTCDQPISYLMEQAVTNPDLISLAAGLVDQESLPVEETQSALDAILSQPQRAQQALQYGTTQGDLRLRELTLARHELLEGRANSEMSIDVEDTIITTGSQQILHLISNVLIDPGDIVLMGAPEYFVFLGTLTAVGAKAVPVPMDENGMIPEALDETFQFLDDQGELSRIKMLYIGSYHQNPSGVSLSTERRPAILEIVERWSQHGRIFVLEDAAYRELTYEGEQQPSIRSFDETGETVILTQTFSKPFSPGMKTGFTILPKALMDPILQQKGNEDFGSSNFLQHLLAEVMSNGSYAKHVEFLKDRYREKRDVTIAALEKECSARSINAHWAKSRGGLYVWLVLPDHDTTHTGQLFRRAIDNGVLFVPGEYCFATEYGERLSQDNALGNPRTTMRLTFGVQSLDGIREGIKRLADTIAEFS